MIIMLYDTSLLIFLSTLSLRRATHYLMPSIGTLRFLSTLSLRRATVFWKLLAMHKLISIHALLAESDIGLTYDGLIASAFLSTLSLRRATNSPTLCWIPKTDFYPRSPCGERPTTIITICIVLKFLSTLSLRRATDLIHSKQS